MSYLQIIGLVLLVFLCIYVIVDRICNCLERRSTMDAYGKFARSKYDDMEDFDEDE